jgi:hypothetical protein
VRIRVSGISVNGFHNMKPIPPRNRCGSGRANGGGGMLVVSRHQLPMRNRTVPHRRAHTANHRHLPRKC